MYTPTVKVLKSILRASRKLYHFLVFISKCCFMNKNKTKFFLSNTCSSKCVNDILAASARQLQVTGREAAFASANSFIVTGKFRPQLVDLCKASKID